MRARGEFELMRRRTFSIQPSEFFKEIKKDFVSDMSNSNSIVPVFILHGPHFGKELNGYFRMSFLYNQGGTHEFQQHQGKSRRCDPGVSLFVLSRSGFHLKDFPAEPWNQPFEDRQIGIVDAQLEYPISTGSFAIQNGGNANATFSIYESGKVAKVFFGNNWRLWAFYTHRLRDTFAASVVAVTGSIWSLMKSIHRFFNMASRAYSCGYHKNIIPRMRGAWEEATAYSLAKGGG